MLDRLGWNYNLITIFLASVFSFKRGARIKYIQRVFEEIRDSKRTTLSSYWHTSDPKQ